MEKQYKAGFYGLLLIVVVGLLLAKSCSDKKDIELQKLEEEKKEVYFKLSLTTFKYDTTISQNKILQQKTKVLIDSISKIKIVKKPIKPKVFTSVKIDSSYKDDFFVLEEDYLKLEERFDSSKVELVKCIDYSKGLIFIIDKKDSLISVKDSLFQKQSKGIDELIEYGNEQAGLEYKRGLRKGRKQGIIAGWFSGILALIGANVVK